MNPFEDVNKDSFEKLCISEERKQLLIKVGKEFLTILNEKIKASPSYPLIIIDVPYLVEKILNFCEVNNFNKIEQSYFCFSMGYTLCRKLELK